MNPQEDSIWSSSCMYAKTAPHTHTHTRRLNNAAIVNRGQVSTMIRLKPLKTIRLKCACGVSKNTLSNPKKLQNISRTSKQWTVCSLHLLLWQSWSQHVNGAFCSSCIIHFILQADSRSVCLPICQGGVLPKCLIARLSDKLKNSYRRGFLSESEFRGSYISSAAENRKINREKYYVLKRVFLHNGQWFMIIYLAKVAIRSVDIYRYKVCIVIVGGKVNYTVQFSAETCSWTTWSRPHPPTSNHILLYLPKEWQSTQWTKLRARKRHFLEHMLYLCRGQQSL